MQRPQLSILARRIDNWDSGISAFRTTSRFVSELDYRTFTVFCVISNQLRSWIRKEKERERERERERRREREREREALSYWILYTCTFFPSASKCLLPSQLIVKRLPFWLLYFCVFISFLYVRLQLYPPAFRSNNASWKSANTDVYVHLAQYNIVSSSLLLQC